MTSRRVYIQVITLTLVISILFAPFSVINVSAQGEPPEPASPFDGYETFEQGEGAYLPVPMFTIGGFKAALPGGGDRLVETQNADGGWGWPLTSPSAANTIGPIAQGLAKAYLHTGSASQLQALEKAGDFLLTKTNNFSASDGYLAAQLDEIFGGTTYRDFVKANFYDKLAAGTYERSGVLHTTASYVNLIRTNRSGSQANLAAWDIGLGVVGAAAAGADPSEWVAGTEAEINELNGDAYYDVIGLAGALYGLAYVGAEFDPTAGEHAAASNLSDLANILASYQIEHGGFAWNSAYVIPNDSNETIQETAYAILALNEVNRSAYMSNLRGAAHYVLNAQLANGGWESYTGSGENNEITGEALWGLATVQLPSNVFVKHPSNPLVTGSWALDPVVINDGGVYKMWYTHVSDAGVWSIYYADSADGITWDNRQEVLGASGTPGVYDEVRVAGPAVINDGGVYKMWFSARDANGVWTIGYATSPEGLYWTTQGEVLEQGAAGAWDSQMVREPSVIKDGGTYKMWYAGTANWPVFKIGYATSPDGVTWTKHGTAPIFTGTADGWDGYQVYAPSVVLEGGTYHMFFSGTDNNMSQKWSTGRATSVDGITWTEYAYNPILIPDTGDSLDYVGALFDEGVWKVWYSYGGSYAIGLATQTEDTRLWLEPAVASIANDNNATQTYNLRISNAVDLYGYQIVLTFDPNKVEVTAAAFDNSFFDTTISAIPGWDATYDNTAGTVSFARTRINPALPIAGDGPLATVTFRGKAGATSGSSKIDFGVHILADRESNVLAHDTQYAWLTLFGTGDLSGDVDLQGRTDESGGTVTIFSAAGYLASTGIAGDGTWSFTGVPTGDYQVNIEMDRYLDAQNGTNGGGVTVTAGGTTLNQVKLLGGDANDDDVVDISDAGIIGSQFGKSGVDISDLRADINNDNAVDILDLVLMGGNYTKTSPVIWP